MMPNVEEPREPREPSQDQDRELGVFSRPDAWLAPEATWTFGVGVGQPLNVPRATVIHNDFSQYTARHGHHSDTFLQQALVGNPFHDFPRESLPFTLVTRATQL